MALDDWIRWVWRHRVDRREWLICWPSSLLNQFSPEENRDGDQLMAAFVLKWDVIECICDMSKSGVDILLRYNIIYSWALSTHHHIDVSWWSRQRFVLAMQSINQFFLTLSPTFTEATKEAEAMATSAAIGPTNVIMVKVFFFRYFCESKMEEVPSTETPNYRAPFNATPSTQQAKQR